MPYPRKKNIAIMMYLGLKCLAVFLRLTGWVQCLPFYTDHVFYTPFTTIGCSITVTRPKPEFL